MSSLSTGTKAISPVSAAFSLNKNAPRESVDNHAQPTKHKGRQVKQSNFLGDLGGKILISGFSTRFLEDTGTYGSHR
jgi:hypothetical protein